MKKVRAVQMSLIGQNDSFAGEISERERHTYKISETDNPKPKCSYDEVLEPIFDFHEVDCMSLTMGFNGLQGQFSNVAELLHVNDAQFSQDHA